MHGTMKCHDKWLCRVPRRKIRPACVISFQGFANFKRRAMEREIAVELVVAVTCLLLLVEDDGRERCLARVWLSWRHHSQLLLNEGQFQQYYRISFRSFENLLRFLTPRLSVDDGWDRAPHSSQQAPNVHFLAREIFVSSGPGAIWCEQVRVFQHPSPGDGRN